MENMQRIPPHDLEAEQAVLTCMLYEREAVSTATEVLKAEDFYSPSNSAVFDAMLDLFNKNMPIDIITLKNKLEEKAVFDAIGGMEFLSGLVAGYYASAHVRQYAKIIEEKSILRKLIKATNDISAMAYAPSEPVASVLEQAEKSIFGIAQNRNSGDFTHINQILVSAVNKIEESFLSNKKITGLETGFNDFDDKTSGLQPSDLILIAARPSMGKTAFALNIAQHVAVRNKVPTAIFSLEMSKEQLVNRLISAEAFLDAQKLRNGELDDNDFMKIIESMGTLSRAEMYIDDTPGITVAELRGKCRKLKMEKGLGLVVIDYLQLMSGSAGRNDSRQQEISEISRSLKSIAREIGAPVIALSQLSRAVEQRADHRPMLSDLRESGAIEQDADLVAFLYREDYYKPDTEKKGIAEIIIAKQRNGPVGTVELMWLNKYTKFANIDRRVFD